MRADIDWSPGLCSWDLAWYVEWLDDYYHGITVIRISSVSWGLDTIWIILGWRNLNPPLFLVIWLEEDRKKKRKKTDTKWSARKLIWTGINSVQSLLASLMVVQHTVRASTNSRKDMLHPFLWLSLNAVILSSFNPHFSQSLPLPPNLQAPAWSFSLPFHPSIRPRQRHYVLTQPAKGTN